MTTKFVQKTGKIYVDGIFTGLAYSGRGNGLNNPDMQFVKNIGVIPVGKYIAKQVDEPNKGPLVWKLIPENLESLKGRSDFMVHWDNKFHNYTASEGCIIPLTINVFYKLAKEFELEVVTDD